MKISEAISAFLTSINSPHAVRFHVDLEVQVDPVSEEEVFESKFICNPYKIRLPKNGSTQPTDNDREMPYPVDLIQRIGVSGWNWRARQSEFVIFDFDAQEGHGEGLPDDELRSLKDAAPELPYVGVHRSKGGKGFHFYISINSKIDSNTRKDHTDVAYAVLEQMRLDSDVDFAGKACAKGVLGWIWDRNAAAEGFVEDKKADMALTLPENWRDMATAAKLRSRKLPKNQTKNVQGLAASAEAFELDGEHQQLIEWLEVNGWETSWEDGYLRTHTAGLKAAHDALKLRGVFQTNSVGMNPHEPNCFCFPRSEGRWVVRRYNPGCPEAETWRKDASNWTYCYFNELPDFATACDTVGGTPFPKGLYEFESVNHANRAIELLGAEIEVPERLRDRPIEFKPDPKGIAASIKAEKADRDEDGPGWRLYRGKWEKIIRVELREPETPGFDLCVRRLLSHDGQKACGWTLQTDNGRWIDEDKDNCKLRLRNVFGFNDDMAKLALGDAVGKPWTLVNIPFGEEYPGGRNWNRDGAQFKVAPATTDGRSGHWDKILAHCGKGLNEAVAGDEWCRENRVQSGADYLRLWVASMFQRPKQALPYLFFYSEETELGLEIQSTGKSTFHEAIDLFLLTKGYQKTDATLINPNGFNGELESAILCVVEEEDVTRGKSYNRIKEWVNAKRLNIHRKGGTPYMSEFNSTHWVQCANRRKYCPVFDGDSRIVVIEVPPIPDEDFITEQELHRALEAEAPYFLRKVLNLELPPPHPRDSRVYLPVLSTRAKRDAAADQRDERLAGVLNSLIDLGRNLRIWDLRPKDITVLLAEEVAPATLGKAINNDLKTPLEDAGLVIQTRTSGGKRYLIAPKWLVEDEDAERIRDKVLAGDWTVVEDEDGVRIRISADDPEATLPGWEDSREAIARMVENSKKLDVESLVAMMGVRE